MNTKFIVIGIIALIGGFLILGKVLDNGQANIRDNGATSSGSVRQAADFTLSRLGGGTITLSDYRGEKPVILDFFATWCPNCRRDMPKLSKLYEKYKDEVEVIGVDLQESEGTVKKFIDSHNITFPIVFDPSGRTSYSYGVRYTNTHVLIDKEGNLVRLVSGDISESDIKSLIEL